MPALSTNAMRSFQQKVHAGISSNQKEIKLSITEARNLSNEISQLSALMLELSQVKSDSIDIDIQPNKF